MNDTTQTLLRSVLKIGAGWLVTKGFTDSSTAEIITAGIVALTAVVWGIFHRNQAQPAQPVKINQGPLMLALAATLLIGASGCGTPARIAYNTAAAPAVTVDHAMTMWGDYVKQFHPPAADELKVKTAFEKYQGAEVIAIDAAQEYATVAASTNAMAAATLSTKAQLASQNASAALSDLVALLQQLGALSP